MAHYASSDIAKNALIMAAGELFAEYSVKAVTTRAIAKKSGENIGNIKYHFGNKEGLLNAVVDYVITPWQDNPIGAYLRDNENLFATQEGQIRLIEGIIETFYSLFFPKDRPLWCGMLMFQILQHDLPASKKIFDIIAAPLLESIFSIYRRISGDNDEEKSLAWLATITAPVHLFSLDQATFRKALDSSPESMLLKLREMTVTGALANIGLLRTEKS